MKQAMLAAVVGFAILVGGCTAEGFSSREVRGQDVTSYLYASESSLAAAMVPGDAEPAGLGGPIAVARPAALAVVQVGEVAPPTRVIDNLAKHTGQFRSVSGISGITPPVVSQSSTKSPVAEHARHLRALARDLGADYLLIYGGTIETTERGTPLSLLDITIVGGFIVPSRVLEAEARGAAAIIEVNTGRVIATATADGTDTSYTPSFTKGGTQRQQSRHVRDEVVERLITRAIDRFSALEGQPAASAAR